MAQYQIKFSFAIGSKGCYTDTIKVDTTDFVPDGTDPVHYLRERIGSEIKRVTKDVEFDTTV
jgi:hypothetical protein